MTKLEAWKAWCATAGTDGTAFTLEKSSHGKAFSYAWDAATAAEREACAQLCDIRETMFKGYKTDGLAALCAAAIRARSNT